MIYIKIIGIILVILSGSGIGFYMSNECSERFSQLIELKKIIVLIRGDIKYANTPLIETIDNIALRIDNIFKSFFIKVSSDLKDFSGITFKEVWENAVDKELLNTSLSKTDKQLLKKMSENLGYLDKEMQINTLDFCLEQLGQAINEAEKEKKDKGRIFKCLGVMGSIFLVIILI